MQTPLQPTAVGSYVHTSEAFDRAKELSREALRNLLDLANEDANLGSSGNGDVSDTGDLE